MTGAIDPQELERLRAMMPTTTRVAYLNAGAMGPWPQASYDAQAACLREELDVRLPGAIWQSLFALQDAARAAVARLVSCEPRQAALTHTSTTALNVALWGLPLERGDNVVTCDQEHPAITTALRALADRRGIEVRVVPATPRLERDLAASCDSRTAAIAISHVLWTTGQVLDLRTLAAEVRTHGTRLVVDGAQGAGALPVSVDDGWDAYTVSGQKWTLGPNGSGALVVRDPAAWLPTFGGFMSLEDPFAPLDSPWAPDHRRFEFSQEARVPLAGFAASVEWLLDEVGVDRAAAHSAFLNAYAREQLGELATDATGTAHLLCLRVDDAPAHATALSERHGVETRALGDRTLRASLGFWNTTHDVDRFVRGLREELATERA